MLTIHMTMAWANLLPPCGSRIPSVNGVNATDLFRRWSIRKHIQTFSDLVEAPPLPPAPEGEEHPQFRVDHCAEARMCRLRGLGACWSLVFPLSFSIMLIWFLLITATLHYSYSFRALNHSDGYNLTSTNLPNSAPLHFFLILKTK